MHYTLRDLSPSSAALAARNERVRLALIEREARASSYARFARVAFGA